MNYIRLPALPRSVLRAVVLLCLSMTSYFAVAQTANISWANSASTSLQPPTYAQDAQYIVIDASTLMQAQEGGSLEIQVGENLYALLQVVEIDSYINGDRMIRAQGRHEGQSYSLALTIGTNALYGHISSSVGIRQIYAIGQAGAFRGWTYTPKSLVDDVNGFQNDYVILDREPSEISPTAPDTDIPTILPYKIDSNTGQIDISQAAANIDAIDGSNFKIEQRFSRDSVLVGSSVEAQLTFTNTSAERHTGLFVEVYFLLENSELILAPRYCRQQLSLSLQEVLYCELGDFAPGESKSMLYAITTSELSKPNVISTPIVGNARLDSIINVVDDVRTDSDLDGVSDFNEAILNTDPFDASSVDSSETVIDVMAIYTAAAAEMYPFGVETRINQLISVANQVYSDSGVDITLRPVFHGEIDYNDSDDMDTALDKLIYKTDAAFAQVDSQREQYGADVVMLFRPLEIDSARCGLAPVGGFNAQGDFGSETEKDFAYSYIGIDCPADIVVAHELGHNFGLTHSHLEDGSGGTFDFSTGFGLDSQFATIMAYPAAFNTSNRIARFSDPQADCLGFPCGLDASNEFGADAVQSLNLVRHQLADYFQNVVPDLPITVVATLDGSETGARIAIAASTDDGLSFVNTVGSNQEVDLIADIYVDAEHVGSVGEIYVLIGLGDSGFFQLDDSGKLDFWDGSIDGLLPYGEASQLRTLERLNILDDHSFGEELIGKQVVVYIAYQVVDVEAEEGGDFVYTINPLIIDVTDSPSPTMFNLETDF